MNSKLSPGDPASFKTPLLAVFAVDTASGKDTTPSPVLLTASAAVSAAAAAILASGEFKSGSCETLVVHRPAGLAAERLLIVGVGKLKNLSADEVRKAAGAAIRAAKPRGIRDLGLIFPELPMELAEHSSSLPVTATVRALVEGAEIAEPEWDTYRSDRKDLSVRSLTVLASYTSELEGAFAEGVIVAAAQNFARHLVNEPGNVLTPTVLGARAKAMCEEVGLVCEVFSTDKLMELKMGAFAAVAQGSSEPPTLIIMTYTPDVALPAGAPVLGLVGKGITFDTGGISIKSADKMELMKYDMAGSAAMIGAMRAIAQLKPAVKVIGIICSAENMPDGKACKPGDVVTAMSGKTIEIINTDAEGRMVLADGLHYAKTLGCTHLIDAATLTGACVVALGHHYAGVFTNDEPSYEAFLPASRVAGEKFWRLPCTEEYRDQIKSAIGDIMNTGGRAGGASTAAVFLKEFAGDTPWIHLDIAGTAWDESDKPWRPKGPTGIAVRSIVEWARTYAGKA